MSLGIYKIIHLVGIAMTLLAVGGMAMHAITDGEKKNPWRRSAVITHGVGLFLALLGGFGMLARLEIHWPWPGWVAVKFGIWLVLGGTIAMLYRKPALNKGVWWGTLFLFFIAAYMAGQKPF